VFPSQSRRAQKGILSLLFESAWAKNTTRWFCGEASKFHRNPTEERRQRLVRRDWCVVAATTKGLKSLIPEVVCVHSNVSWLICVSEVTTATKHQEHDNVSYKVTGNNTPCYLNCRFQWPRCLRFRSAAAWLLGSQVRIPLRAWMFVLYLYVVLFCVGRGLCDGLITRPEKSYCLSNCVWLRNLKRGGQGPIWSVAP
jgi:hypothetical protein